MDREAFTHMAATEGAHWWFVGRRRVIETILDGIDLPAEGRILEAGCGTGGNLATLSRRGRILAFEPHLDALAFARERHPSVEIVQGALPEALPAQRRTFDLVAALDVLEHIEDDVAAAMTLRDLVRPGGWLLVTVPAHRALWGSHDRRLHHMRRYDDRRLRSLFADPALQLIRFTSFNTLLAPLAVLYRIGERFLHIDLGNQERLPPAPVNRALAAIFGLEAAWLRKGGSLPIGLSFAALYQRRA